MTTAISPAVTFDSHDPPAPCPICGGSFHVHRTDTDLEVCDDCQWHRVRSETPAMLTSSHDAPAVLAVCVLCSGAMIVCDDLDICSACGSRRVRSQPKAAATGLLPCLWCGASDVELRSIDLPNEQQYWVACYKCETGSPVRKTRESAIALWNSRAAAASRDASLTAFVDDLLDVLQDVGGMSAEWCETELRKFETLLRNETG